MSLSVLFVSGPRRAGKSTVIQQFIETCEPRSPHYLRLASRDGDKHQPADTPRPPADCRVASAKWITYEEDRVYEFLPTALSEIHRHDRRGLVIIEGDSDPLLRHAYPYDWRVFVMPAPQRMSDVFRSPAQAAEAFTAALNDTAAFAGEIYGLVEKNGDDFDLGDHDSRSDMTAAQVRGLMNTPLGHELATRILLQPSHHGLLDSDILIVNTAVGGTSSVLDGCVRRLEKVLDHLRGPTYSRRLLFACDPADPEDPLRTKLFNRLADLIGCTDPHDNGSR